MVGSKLRKLFLENVQNGERMGAGHCMTWTQSWTVFFIVYLKGIELKYLKNKRY